MKSQWITLYSLDFKTAFTVKYEGFYSYKVLIGIINTNNYIVSSYDFVDVVQDGHFYLGWDVYSDRFVKMSGGFKNIEEIEFWEIWKPIEYRSSFNNLINDD